VCWSGSDDAGGSGVAGYDVYVSDNGGDYARWLSGTLDTSATFTGQTGHTYAFYSIATDNVGHQESAPAAPDTQTLVTASTLGGVFDPRGSMFYLAGDLATGNAEHIFGYGVPDAAWQTLTGDWNGDGSTGVGLYDPKNSVFYLTNACTNGCAEYTFAYGQAAAGWIPLVGDWDGDGKASVGLYDPLHSMFYLTNTLQTGYAEYTFGYGEPGAGWVPLVGDWDGNGTTGVGLYDPVRSTFYLTDTLTTGVAEHTLGFGQPGAGWEPLVGCWRNDATSSTNQSDGEGTTTASAKLNAHAVDQIDLPAVAEDALANA
jgi:hypothetical protein